MSPHPAYHFIPLRTSTTIRALKLDPANDGYHSVSGQLQLIDLDESPSPKFATLSYEWGNPDAPKVTVVCNGYDIEVTENCLAALQSLRADLLQEGLPIWIDAICIDQENSKEKNIQLPMMGRIYSEATKSYIWLGPGNTDTDSAMDYLMNPRVPFRNLACRVNAGMYTRYCTILKSAYHFFLLSVGPFGIWDITLGSVSEISNGPEMAALKEFITSFFRAFLSPGVRDSLTFFAVLGPAINALRMYLFSKEFELSNSSVIHIIAVNVAWHLTCLTPRYPSKGLSDLLSRRWIDRLWTLQEAVLPKDSVLVCGNKRIPWQVMLYAIEYMGYFESKKLAQGSRLPSAYHTWRRLQLFWFLGQRDRIETTAHTIPLDLQLGSYREPADRAWDLSLVMTLAYHLYLAAIQVLVINGYSWLRVLAALLLICMTSPLCSAIYAERVKDHNRKAQPRDGNIPYQMSEAIMVEIQTRQSERAEDKYFAVLGLIGGARSNKPPVDSKTDLALIYRELFITLLHYTSSLNVLMFTSQKKFNDTPSWVVDWRDAPLCWTRARYYSKHLLSVAKRRSHHVQVDEYEGASSKSASVWSFRLDDQQLIVQGRVIGKLSSSMSWCEDGSLWLHEGTTDSASLFSASAFWFAIMTLKGPNAQREAAEGLVRFFESCSNQFHGRSSDRWQRVICDPKGHGADSAENGLRVQEQLRQHEGDENTSSPALAWQYHMAIAKFLADEKMALVTCSTSAAHRNFASGVAPANAQLGDSVALIAGVSTPMINESVRAALKSWVLPSCPERWMESYGIIKPWVNWY